MAALDPKNLICDSPNAFSRVLEAVVDFPDSGGDASPIYLTLDASLTINAGSHYGETGSSEEDIEYTYTAATIDSYAYTRAGLRDLGLDPDISAPYEIPLDYAVSTWIDPLRDDGSYDMTGKFLAFLSRLPSDGSNSIFPFSPPVWICDSAFTDITHDEADGYDLVSGVDQSLDPPEEVSLDSILVEWAGPRWRGTIEGGDLEMYFVLVGNIDFGYAPNTTTAEIVVDCSAWTSADFRDIRGTYSTTTTNAGGIDFDWSITIG